MTMYGKLISTSCLLWFVVTGCEQPTDAPLSWEEYVEDARRVEDGREFYLIEGDIGVLSLEVVREHYEFYLASHENTEYRSTVNVYNGARDVVDSATVLAFKYCVSTDFGAKHAQAVSEMATATAAYEEVANINFVYVPAEDGSCSSGNTAVDFVVDAWNGGAGQGCATFPNDPELYGCPFPDSVVMDFPEPGEILTPPTDGTTLGAFMHELGHKLGLVHEFYHTDGCQTSTHAEDLTEFDSLSVMMYPGSCGKPEMPYELTASDGEGLRALYGMPVAWYVAGGVI